MARFLFAGGWLAALIGAAMIFPVVIARLENGGMAGTGNAVFAVACGLIACGAAAVCAGWRGRQASAMPSAVRAVVAANALFLAFFALELSDRLVRQDGKIFYWTTYLLLPALLLFCGLLAAQPWAWWTARGAAALGVLWFVGFLALIPFADLQSEAGPVPWYGRLYMACVTLAFAGIMAGAFRSLGRAETRSYFGLARAEQRPAAEAALPDCGQG